MHDLLRRFDGSPLPEMAIDLVLELETARCGLESGISSPSRITHAPPQGVPLLIGLNCDCAPLVLPGARVGAVGGHRLRAVPGPRHHASAGVEVDYLWRQEVQGH